jgi:hypothetical protein
MSKAVFLAALAAAALSTPVAAQSWGVGVGVTIGEPPVYYDPPPVYYEPAPVYVAPPVIGGPAPVYVAPGPVAPPVLDMVSPDEVFDRLDEAGYTNLTPMARRGNLYRLNAVDPYGNLVALRISIFSGEVERADILQAAYAPPPPAATPGRIVEPVAAVPQAAPVAPPVAVAPQAEPPPPPTNGQEPAAGDDPLVIY